MINRYKETKQKIFEMITNISQKNTAPPTQTQATPQSTSTDPTETTEDLPYFVPRNELTKKM